MEDDRSPIVIEDETLRHGFTSIPNVILKRHDISPGAKLCYVMLLTYAWQEASCFPGQERLAEDMGVVKRSVVTYMKELQDSGLVVVKRRGLGKTNVYTLPRSANFAPLEVQKTAHPKVQNLHPKKTQVNTSVQTREKSNEEYLRSVEQAGYSTDPEKMPPVLRSLLDND